MPRPLLILALILTGAALADPMPGAPPLPTPPLISAEALSARVHPGEPRPRLLLVNIWASWCAPCREEWPILAAVARDHHDDLELLAISTDAPDDGHALAAFLDTQDTPFPVVWWQGSRAPLESALGGAWLTSMPTSVLFDRDGERVLTVEGALSEDALRATLDALLHDTEATPEDTP